MPETAPFTAGRHRHVRRNKSIQNARGRSKFWPEPAPGLQASTWSWWPEPVASTSFLRPPRILMPSANFGTRDRVRAARIAGFEQSSDHGGLGIEASRSESKHPKVKSPKCQCSQSLINADRRKLLIDDKG